MPVVVTIKFNTFHRACYQLMGIAMKGVLFVRNKGVNYWEIGRITLGECFSPADRSYEKRSPLL